MARTLDRQHLPREMSYPDVQRVARDAGFERSRCCGDHEQWQHADGRRVTLLAGHGTYHTGTLHAVLKVLLGLSLVALAVSAALPLLAG